MKKRVLFLFVIVMITSLTIKAQIAVNNDGTSPHGSAMLDVKSTDKGVLLPRMAQSEIATITNPSNGLTVFNTTDNHFYFYDAGAGEWKEVAIGAGTITPILPAYVGDYRDGGVVFYVDGTGNHGLVCAVSDQSESTTWGCSGTLVGANGDTIGTGAQNTLNIESGCATSGIAADICANLILNGHSDWFLPSVDELYEIYLNQDTINTTATSNGGTDLVYTGIYWSSSENNNPNWVYTTYFFNGASDNNHKSYTNRVRAVRAF